MAATTLFFPEGLARMGPDLFRKIPRLFSLDFDGTLSEIAETPQAAWMAESLRTDLWALSSMPETQVVILSGRSIPDLKKKVQLPGIVYAGNHGLDFSPPSAGWGSRALRGWTRSAGMARERLRPLSSRWPGVLLEAKGPDLSLHYRNLKPRQARKFIPEVLKAVQGLPIVVRHGKRVLEFRPQGAPGKGEALKRMADRFFKDKFTGVCFHIGDDQTDEDAFQALRRMDRKSLGLKVGEGKTRAHFLLKNVRQVHRFIKLFMESQEKS